MKEICSCGCVVKVERGCRRQVSERAGNIGALLGVIDADERQLPKSIVIKSERIQRGVRADSSRARPNELRNLSQGIETLPACVSLRNGVCIVHGEQAPKAPSLVMWIIAIVTLPNQAG